MDTEENLENVEHQNDQNPTTLEEAMKMKNCRETWRYIFATFGEQALFDFAKQHYNPNDFFGRNLEEQCYGKLSIALMDVPLTPAQFWHYAKTLSWCYKPELFHNKLIPCDVMEYLLVGDYVDNWGNPLPELGQAQAFMLCHYMLRDLYCRKQSVRKILSPRIRRMLNLSLEEDGQIPPGSDDPQSFDDIIN
jgi:hypothetical protein